MTTPTVLIVEDDSDQRWLMGVALRRHGFETLEAESFAAATEALAASAPVDLVVADYDLGDGVGTAVLDRAAELGIAGLLVTGRSAAEFPDDYEVFRKPVRLDDFLERARALIGGAATPPPAAPEATFDLVLYVAEGSALSRSTELEVRRAIEATDESVHLEVRDLDRDPDLLDPEDRVVFTPTLIRRRPLPKVWIVGAPGDELDALLWKKDP